MQKLIWGILLVLFIIDVLKKNSIKEEIIKESIIDEKKDIPNNEIKENKPSRTYSEDKAVLEIKYWYLNFYKVKILIVNILKS